MDRPVVGKYRRGFLFVSVAAFVFWVALIYVFNRNVVVDDEIDIRSLIITGKDLIHPNAVERSEETVLRVSDSKDAGVDEEIRQSPRDAAHGDVLNKEPDDGVGTEEEVQQPLRNTADKKDSNEEMVDVVGATRGVVQQPLMIVADWKDSNEEPIDGVGTKGAVQKPLRNAADRKDSNEELFNSMQIKDEVQQPARNVASRVDPDEEMVDSMQTKDREAQQPLRNITEGYGSKRVKNSTKIDEESQQPLRNVTDEVGDGSDEELLNTELANDRARDPVEEEIIAETDSCEGRYIFIQILPRRFHVDLLRKCKSLSAWTDMCETLSNAGLGPELPRTEKVLSKTGWFSTNQFSLEVIFHNRMKQYKCLTNDSSIATAIYIPYYAGLDVAQYLWHSTEYRDIGPHELVRWLRARPEWKRMFGRDHFLVAGRISWDFRRETFNDSDWGTNLLVLPEVKQMTSLVLESTLIPDATDFAIPYPTYFHPSSDADVIHWQNRMRQLKRPFLFSFAGARRPNLLNSIRDEIIDQCRATKSKCKLLECYSRGNTCYRPVNLIRLFQESIFCLQPQGDSYTRRSTFDSILTGCIPVFFHSGSAYDQYKWHLPSDHTKYSVFIPEGQVKKGKVNIESVLSSIPKSKVEEMQQEVLELIPKIVYADPRSMLETFEDAFDLAVKGVLKRMNTIRRGT